MNLKSGALLTAILAAAGSTQAADRPAFAGLWPPIIADPPRIVVVNPECIERMTRLLGCRRFIPVFPDDPRVVRIIDRPPRVRLRPYPEIFAW